MNANRTDSKSTGSRGTSTDSNSSSLVWGNIDHSSTYRNALRETEDFPEDFLDTSSPKKPVAQSEPEVPKYEEKPLLINAFEEAMDRQNHEYVYGTNYAANTAPSYHPSPPLDDDRSESPYRPETNQIKMFESYSVDDAAAQQCSRQSAKRDEQQFLSFVKKERTGTPKAPKQSRRRKQDFAAEDVNSTKDESDPLDAQIPSDIVIDTANICDVITNDLKKFAISQTLFAERVLGRSQGTLSDLLRNPKPWKELKSGRATFTRMYNWLMLPLEQRLDLLGLELGEDNKVVRQPKLSRKERLSMAKNEPKRVSPSPKRTRVVFTDVQKKSLHIVYSQNQRPSKAMQDVLADNLNLELATVANFFMNQRRRHHRAQKKMAQVEVAPVEEVQVEEDEDSESEEDDDVVQPGQPGYQYGRNVMG